MFHVDGILYQLFIQTTKIFCPLLACERLDPLTLYLEPTQQNLCDWLERKCSSWPCSVTTMGETFVLLKVFRLWRCNCRRIFHWCYHLLLREISLRFYNAFEIPVGKKCPIPFYFIHCTGRAIEERKQRYCNGKDRDVFDVVDAATTTCRMTR